MSTDPFERTRGLLAQTDAYSRELNELAGVGVAPAEAGSETLTASDDHDLVTVTIEPDGKVLDIALASDWREEIEPEQLAAQVKLALDTAASQVLSDWSERVQERQEDLKDEVRPGQDGLQESGFEPAGDMSDPSTRSSIDELSDLLGSVDSQLTALEQAIGRATQATATSTADRAITVEVEAGRVSDLQIDARWLRNTHDQGVERALVDAIRHSVEDSAQDEDELIGQFPAVAQAMTALQNPDDMLRKLGLLR